MAISTWSNKIFNKTEHLILNRVTQSQKITLWTFSHTWNLDSNICIGENKCTYGYYIT